MSVLIYELNKVIPSDPEIEECPAWEFDETQQYPLETYVKISKLEKPVQHRGTSVAAVLGPIACTSCEHQCPEAYIAISSARFSMISLMGIETAAIPLTINQDNPVNPFVTGLNSSPPRLEPDQIITHELAHIESSAVISVDATGKIFTHSEAFQPELDFGQDKNRLEA